MPHEFTAGPFAVYAKDPFIVVDPHGASVADCAPGNPYLSPEEARANARLFAQAPRLLKHLEKAYKVLTRLSAPVLDNAADNGTEGPGADEMMEAMQRAIGDAGGSTE